MFLFLWLVAWLLAGTPYWGPWSAWFALFICACFFSVGHLAYMLFDDWKKFVRAMTVPQAVTFSDPDGPEPSVPKLDTPSEEVRERYSRLH